MNSELSPSVPGRIHLSCPVLRWAVAMVLAVFLGLHGNPGVAQETPPVPRVGVALSYTEEVTDEAVFIGRGEAIDQVALIARVNGFLMETIVQEGALVKEGDLLFRIESDTYEATLESKNADLARAEANLELASIDLARKEELLKRQSVSESERDISRANELVAEADVRAANAAIRQADLDLSYTKIHAPFDGRIGQVDPSEGAIVGPTTAALATLVRETPMYVSFSLNEKQLIDVIQRLDGTDASVLENDTGPDVFLDLPNGTRLEEIGKIVFVDNRINPLTGAIALRAQFPNKDRLIIDGSFLNVRIQAVEPVAKILIPQAAIQRDQRGDFVLVVTEKNTVEQRYVVTGTQVGTAMVIEDNLREGESVIVEGLQRVRPGVAVDSVVAAQPGE